MYVEVAMTASIFAFVVADKGEYAGDKDTFISAD